MPDAARPHAPRRVALLALLPLALGVAFLLLGIVQHRRADPYPHGRTATATVVSVPRSGRYGLALPGDVPVAEVHAPVALAVGDRVRVSYPAGSPQRMRVVTGSRAWLVDLVAAWLFVFLAVVLAAAVLLPRRTAHAS